MKCAADSRLPSTRTITSLALWKAITPTSAGIAAALGFPGRAKAPECTLGERSDVRIVHQFSAAWSGHSLDRPMSFFVDNGAYGVSVSARTFKRKAAVRAGIQSFPDRVTQFEIIDPLAKGPTIFNQRIDHFNGGSLRSCHGVGVTLGVSMEKLWSGTTTRSHSTGRRGA